MYVVGLTGGIGSGKTAVSDYLASRGIRIVDADVVAREVVVPGTPALAQIADHFGPAILGPDGNLDRAKLRQEVFSDPAEKRWLEQLLHPLIGAEVLAQLAAATSPYVVLVSPLLVEMGQTALCDRVLVVDVAESVQIERTCRRDDNTEQQVKAILAAQGSREQRLAAATDILDNSGDLATLETLAAGLHEQFLTLANGASATP